MELLGHRHVASTTDHVKPFARFAEDVWQRVTGGPDRLTHKGPR
ncbi:hypothetical protein ACFWP2_30025 [Kitasatospora sp. NPDC058444]